MKYFDRQTEKKTHMHRCAAAFDEINDQMQSFRITVFFINPLHVHINMHRSAYKPSKSIMVANVLCAMEKKIKKAVIKCECEASVNVSVGGDNEQTCLSFLS